MKARLIWLATGLAVLSAVALTIYLLVPTFHPSRAVVFAPEMLPEDSVIEARTRVDGYGVHLGDAFPYTVEVLYDGRRISKIDTASLDMRVNLAPFELRAAQEVDFRVDDRTRIYRREYTLQLVQGTTNTIYDFPSIVIRYQLKDSGNFAEKTIIPEPVFVSARFPAETEGLALRPLRGKISDESRRHLPWILWALGGVMLALGVIDVTWRVIPQWRTMNQQQRGIQHNDVLVQAYRSLHANVAEGCEPQSSLRQMRYILSMVFVRQGQMGWLDELNPERAPAAIRAQVDALVGAERNGAEEDLTEHDVARALQQLEDILAFYYAADVGAWKH